MTLFRPTEVLFCPTTYCNLACPHCDTRRSRSVLSKAAAAKFLAQCGRAGIRRVGFTGGEPFLAPDFLYALSREAVRLGIRFDRIMTNGVWWKTRKELTGILTRLRDSGYDGSLCVSVDAFHKQDPGKLAGFIHSALSVWRRPDIVSVACVTGARDAQTRRILSGLARLLGGRPEYIGTGHACIKGRGIFVKILKIDLSPVGRASRLKNPWDGRWFKEDKCRGPGNVLFILPGGDVKPCCGYATGSGSLTIGNIKRDSARSILKNIPRNSFVHTIYNSGLSLIRKRLEKDGFKFPGKTTNHCYFCHYVLTAVPRKILNRNLDKRDL